MPGHSETRKNLSKKNKTSQHEPTGSQPRNAQFTGNSSQDENNKSGGDELGFPTH